MTVKFEVGQTYSIIARGYELGQVTVTRRTDKSVWLKHEDGTTSRKGLKILNDIEVVQSKDFNLYANRPTEPLETHQDIVETTSEPSQDTLTESQESQESQDNQNFNHFEYIESHYVVKNPPGSENLYTEVPGGWTTLKSVAFTLITAWENGCLDMKVQHWITGLTRDELNTLLSVLTTMFSHAKIKSSEVNQIILGLIPNAAPITPDNVIKVDFAARRRKD